MTESMKRFLAAKHSHDGLSIYDLAKMGNVDAQAAIYAAANHQRDQWMLMLEAFTAHAAANGYPPMQARHEVIIRQAELWKQIDAEALANL